MLVIIALVAVWYGIIPIAGAFYRRFKWGEFRRRFDELRLSPLLNYAIYRRIGNEGGIYRFTGGLESITVDHTLWIRDENLTVPISLANTQSWLLPMQNDDGIPEAPEKIRWNRISTFTEGAKVFVGGLLEFQNNRLSFVSTKENPLMVIFYDCPDTELTDSIIRAGRTRNEYWNNLTPISLAIGAMSLVYMAASYVNRPAFRPTVISALIAIFVPILPMLPPGLLLTVLYRRLVWHARKFRALRDLVRLPLRYLPHLRTFKGLGHEQESGILSTGEKYGFVIVDSLGVEAEIAQIPHLIPEHQQKGKKSPWYIFGTLPDNFFLPAKSIDPFVSFGALPANPRALAKHYAIKAYLLEALAWLVMLAGIGVNVLFILMILALL